MNQRLLQQNARIREAWEAERKYLEANRERAEEVYKEERALMEEERAEWEAEKATLLAEIRRLQQLVLVSIRFAPFMLHTGCPGSHCAPDTGPLLPHCPRDIPIGEQMADIVG
jgi:fibrillarin-like rRNA methylase